MKEITLKKLVLSNWRGQNREVSFGDITRISGKNESGKTALMRAFYFCLTGLTEPYLPKNSNLYNEHEEISENTPWASVEATLEIDGFDYVLERKAKPKYTRAKGSSVWTKAGSDDYEYLIDNIEVGSTAFGNWIDTNICPLTMLPFALSGEFFSCLITENKNKARTILTELAGEVKPEDFKGDYSSIAEMLGRHSASDIVEMSRKKKKPLEERQNAIPNEIDRKEERLAELKAMDFTATEKEIEKIKTEIDAIDGLLLGNADAVKPILDHNAEIENKLANKRLSLVNGRLTYKEEQNARTSEIKAKIAEIKRYNESMDRGNTTIIRDFEEKKENKDALSKRYDALKDYLDTLRNKKNEIKCRVFAEDHCPYCGAELDPMELEAKKIAFNEAKEMELKVIVEEGKSRKEELDKLKDKISDLEKEIEKGYTLIERKDLTPYEEALAKIEASFLPYEDTDEYTCIMWEIDALSKEMKEIPSNDNEALTSRKKTLIESLSELSKKLGLKDEIAKVEKDIVELREELRSVANSIAEIEGHIYSAQAWLQERNEIVSFRINEKLEYSKIEMFATQKNGEVVPDCRLVNKKGVSYGVTNNADKGAIDTDLQKLFMRHYDIALPIFVDEASIYDSEHLPKDDNYQFVYLFASDSPILTVE
jgi:DNA repair exonuclease SbcCD ATPase subunit